MAPGMWIRLFLDMPQAYPEISTYQHPVPCAKINAPTLHYNYKKDPPRAYDEYTGQLLQVSGRITDIVQNANAEAIVKLKTKEELHPVQAIINPDDIHITKSVAVGNGIEVRCEGAGMIDENVILKNCTFVEQTP